MVADIILLIIGWLMDMMLWPLKQITVGLDQFDVVANWLYSYALAFKHILFLDATLPIFGMMLALELGIFGFTSFLAVRRWMGGHQ